VLVFGAIFLDIFRKYRKQAPAAPPPSAVTATPQRAAVSPNGSSNQQQM
jgi:hypothetical protein